MAEVVGCSPVPQGRATHEPGLASRPGHSVGVPNAADVYALATEIANSRYPNGRCCTADLANIVREAARQLGLTGQRKRQERPPDRSAGRHNNLSLLMPDVRAEAERICAETTNASTPGARPCVESGFVCHRCQDLAAAAV